MSSKMYILKGIFFLAALLLGGAMVCFAGCKTDNQKVINARVSERVDAFTSKKIEECRTALLADANKLVDSFMLQDARGQLDDSLINRRPGKPYKPAPIPPIDSLTVKPVFDSEGG